MSLRRGVSKPTAPPERAIQRQRGLDPMKIRVGQMNTLEVVRRIHGAYVLTDGEDRVLLPSEEALQDLDAGDRIEVFIYTNRGVRIATLKKPYGMVGQIVALKVVDTAAPGVFVDWGLEKDLLIPNNKLHSPLQVGDKAVVAIVLDREERVMGVTWLKSFLSTDTSHLKIGQRVSMMVYGQSDRGFQMVVENVFSGMLFFDQTHQNLEIGQELTGFISGIRHDGRLDLALTLPKQKREALRDEQSIVAAAIQEGGGFLALTDKSEPDDIRHELRISKKAFKRAVGALYKAQKITIAADGIRWRDESTPD